MGKITEIQKENLKADLIEGKQTARQLSMKYGVTPRAIKIYKTKWGLSIPPQKAEKPINETEIIEEPPEQELPPLEEVTPEPKTEEPKPEEPTPEPKLEIEAGKDYCGFCYEHGNITELNIGMELCPTCGRRLTW